MISYEMSFQSVIEVILISLVKSAAAHGSQRLKQKLKSCSPVPPQTFELNHKSSFDGPSFDSGAGVFCAYEHRRSPRMVPVQLKTT